MQPGMITSIEPGLYRAGRWGIRIENLVLNVPWHDNREFAEFLEFETLTLAPYDRRLIDVALLSPPERAWVDAYQARVLAEVGPACDPATLAWLREACAPLAA
jgi:Xaa-Pro aminopeptidase